LRSKRQRPSSSKFRGLLFDIRHFLNTGSPVTDTPHNLSGFKSGFAAIIGAPNVGKSTLLNSLIGEKISITSPKPQTTRNRIAGILHTDDAQIVFLDTPGIHHSKKIFNRKMIDVAFSVLEEVDLAIIVIDAAHPDPASESLIIEKFSAHKKIPAILAINKIDLIKKTRILAIINHWAKAHSFEEIIPVSATEGTQLPELLSAMIKLLPGGPPFYPDDIVTDLPVRFIASEMIREKIFLLTGQEIPFAAAVTIESFKEDLEKNLVRIHATIHVERDSQKGIIIGKQGAMLRAIGESARQDIEEMVESKVFLKLFVRVDKNWTKDLRSLKKLGY
jgi:GTP-binding protein Era